jgi:hypothetical protein
MRRRSGASTETDGRLLLLWITALGRGGSFTGDGTAAPIFHPILGVEAAHGAASPFGADVVRLTG